MRGPSSVTATVCSQWAARDPSAVTTVHSSASITVFDVPSVEDSRIRPISLLPEMARIAAEMVHDVLNAFAARDASKAARVRDRDAAVDDFYNSIFRALLTFMMEDPGKISEAAHLLFVAKNLERIGDHATNIAEMVYYAATGERLAERTKGQYRTGVL